jgi:hypothetical protein
VELPWATPLIRLTVCDSADPTRVCRVLHVGKRSIHARRLPCKFHMHGVYSAVSCGSLYQTLEGSSIYATTTDFLSCDGKCQSLIVSVRHVQVDLRERKACCCPLNAMSKRKKLVVISVNDSFHYLTCSRCQRYRSVIIYISRISFFYR